MRRTEATVCDVVDCDLVATGSLLFANRAPAVEFGLCDRHFAELAAGREAVLREAAPGRPPALLIRPLHPAG